MGKGYRSICGFSEEVSGIVVGDGCVLTRQEAFLFDGDHALRRNVRRYRLGELDVGVGCAPRD